MLQRFEHFTSTISSIHRNVQKIERDEMEKHGLRGAFAQYLLAVSRYPEGITAAALCEVCDKDKAAVSRVIAELEAKGLLYRENDGSQYRSKVLLTPIGEAAVSFVQARACAAMELAGSGLSPEDRAVFYSALDLLDSNLHQIARNGIPEENGPSDQ